MAHRKTLLDLSEERWARVFYRKANANCHWRAARREVNHPAF
jgi:hypothetical protein